MSTVLDDDVSGGSANSGSWSMHEQPSKRNAHSPVYHTVFEMAPGPRLSDKELAAINAAAVTREYTVKPHLGM